VLVDGSRIEIFFRVKTFLTTAAVTNRSHATRNFADPVFEPHKHPEFIPCFLLYVVAERFTFSSLSRRFNPIVAITSASAVWSNSFVTRCNCTTTIELDGFKGLGIKDCTVQKSLSII
jgi:hypothetical protein